MTKIISTSILAALLGAFTIGPAFAERDGQERDAYRNTQQNQRPLALPAPTGPVIEGRNVYMAPPSTGATEPYIQRAEEADRRGK